MQQVERTSCATGLTPIGTTSRIAIRIMTPKPSTTYPWTMIRTRTSLFKEERLRQCPMHDKRIKSEGILRRLGARMMIVPLRQDGQARPIGIALRRREKVTSTTIPRQGKTPVDPATTRLHLEPEEKEGEENHGTAAHFRPSCPSRPKTGTRHPRHRGKAEAAGDNAPRAAEVEVDGRHRAKHHLSTTDALHEGERTKKPPGHAPYPAADHPPPPPQQNPNPKNTAAVPPPPNTPAQPTSTTHGTRPSRNVSQKVSI